MGLHQKIKKVILETPVILIVFKQMNSETKWGLSDFTPEAITFQLLTFHSFRNSLV